MCVYNVKISFICNNFICFCYHVKVHLHYPVYEIIWIYHKVVYTMYFDSFSGLDGVLSGARWELKWHVGEGGDASKRHEAATDWFTPTRVVDAHEFSCDGMSVSLAPTSIVYELSDELADQCYMLSTSYISIRMKDGTELVVRDEGAGVVNTYTDTSRDHYTISHTLTQLVDVAQVESIAMVAELDDGRGGEEVREFTLTPTA